MPDKNTELYFIIVVGAIMALLLVGFIVTILFLYQRRRHEQEQELTRIKREFEQELLKSQLEIQEQTFKTIAQELHDNIGQLLSVVKISLSVLPLDKTHPAFEPVFQSRNILNQAIRDLSHITKSLHSDRIRDLGLAESIEFELEAVQKSGLLEVQFSRSGKESGLDEQKRIFLFRIFQESLNNILKHSRAKSVKVDLNFTGDDTFALLIEDNGTGFDVKEKRSTTSNTSGVGLKSLYNRAALIGATLDITSEKGKGTRVFVKTLASETRT
jgi:two-component system, NarL family, sensor kinase